MTVREIELWRVLQQVNLALHAMDRGVENILGLLARARDHLGDFLSHGFPVSQFGEPKI
jgi:hypothetical protein